MKKPWRQLTLNALIALASIAPSGALAQEVNPIGFAEETDIASIITTVAIWAGGLAAAVAVAYLIYGGFIYITGGEKGSESAKKIIVNAIIGLFVIALAFVIVNIVGSVITKIG